MIDRVVINERIGWADVEIWFFSYPQMGKGRVLEPDGETVKYEYDRDGSLQEPTLRMSHYALEKLIAAGCEYLPPTSATVEHLKDSNAVRDRLLTIVERIVK